MTTTTRQELMTREKFLAWLFASKADIRIDPHEVVECACGDVNCRGWRLVRPTPGSGRVVYYVTPLRRSP